MHTKTLLSVVFLGLAWCPPTHAQALVEGSFIQLHRDHAETPMATWRADFRDIKKLGGNRIIVQWTAEAPILYFNPAPDEAVPGLTEVYSVLDSIFTAAEAEGMTLHLGLQHHPEYWPHIRSRGKVVRDFFRLRLASNVRLQAALLQAFGSRAVWTGYYIPDEIDDLSWRDPERRVWIRDYLTAMTALLREKDPGRTVAVSAFFRGRTAPSVMASTLLDITAGTGLDIVMIQDGVGTGDPPLAYLGHYYKALSAAWSTEAALTAKAPALWGIVETFQQTSAPNAPFTAIPANGPRIRAQIEAARPHVSTIVLFTYADYLSPRRGPLAHEAFQHLTGEASRDK